MNDIPLALLLAVAVAIPAAVVVMGWLAGRAERPAGEDPPLWRRRMAIAVAAAPAIGMAAIVVWMSAVAWRGDFTAAMLAIILLVAGLGVGSLFIALEEARPAKADTILKIRHIVQGLAYLLSGVVWVVASFTEGWWFGFAALASAWLGVIRLYMATGRELSA